ncbi:DUF1853 family protein [Marinimicrobium sp. ABcell2]|uniref:DUF1853 family protein n=1 Tax=Marinimicrobium sp. ABcell2 TaxID=3069751 RepID=UPI0027ADFC9E|nr:DUF1853 family protein [Marinimicrobium sp. ABcell2]MDQ2078012.1 DUF1853 family protein [Marinimicrobium sp. ABcell2]
MSILALKFSAFRHQAVRDLAWSCFSPSLMDALPGSDATLLAPVPDARDWLWLEQLDHNPQPLLDALAINPSNRLGLYFESLWRFYLQHHPDWTLLSHNLQVEKAGRTLGAFDFLCRYQDQYWHLELAVKLYLGLPGSNEPSRWDQWWGPNANDRLDIKLARLTSHQLPLSQTDDGKEILSRFTEREVPWRRGLVLRGYYFYPGGTNLAPPAEAHSQHQRGSWWHLTRFLPQLDGAYWYPLARKEWLAPAQLRAEQVPLTGAAMTKELMQTVGGTGRPVLLAKMQQRDLGWHEQERVFVVPDYWPSTALP